MRINGEVSQAPSGANLFLVQCQPICMSLMVTPWNVPAAMAALLHEAGVPDGVVNVIATSTAAEVVDAMLHAARVGKLSFTGSTQVGRILLKSAADQGINCFTELGGNAPFIVSDNETDVIARQRPRIPRLRLRTGGAVRRCQAERPRPRGCPSRDARVHGSEIHRGELVGQQV